jgi:hypothetical protein
VFEEPAEPKQRLKASAWGWIALGSTVASAIGYATQTILDYVPDPSIVGALVYFGLFTGFALAALFSGVIAVVKAGTLAEGAAAEHLLARERLTSREPVFGADTCGSHGRGDADRVRRSGNENLHRFGWSSRSFRGQAWRPRQV